MNTPPTNEPLPDRGRLTTEQRLEASAALDALSVRDALEVIHAQDQQAVAAVGAAMPELCKLIERVASSLRAGGRLIYIGAGTSGRLGVLDASECPPTFQSDPGQVVGIIAGGDTALRRSSEGAEDDPHGARQALDALALTSRDTVVGIMAGGTTPYVWGALRMAQDAGAGTAVICCVRLDAVARGERVAVDHAIELITGPEVVTGSTRMKAGTATKLALNMISTLTMVELGKVWGNLMVDVRASNAKLRDRAARIVMGQTGLSREDARVALDAADGSVKLALVMVLRKLDAAAAQRLLDQHAGQLRPILGDPR